MDPEKQERIRELNERIQKETDSRKLVRLAEELARVFDEEFDLNPENGNSEIDIG